MAMLDLIQASGMNFIRIWTNMEHLMPTYGVIDGAYWANLTRFCNASRERRLYFMITINMGTPNWYTANSLFNRTVWQGYRQVWGNLSASLMGNTYFLGAHIPYNEINLASVHVPLMNGSGYGVGNVTCQWNAWLRNRYVDNVTLLNNTWSANWKSRLNVSNNEIAFIDQTGPFWNESASQGIRLPRNIRLGLTDWDDWRMPDWNLFRAHWYRNMSQVLVNNISGNNTEALLIWAADRSGGIYNSTIPTGVDAFDFHCYFPNSGAVQNAIDRNLHNYLQRDRSSMAYFGFPLVGGESGTEPQPGTGEPPYPWNDAFNFQHYIFGADVVSHFAWEFNGGYGMTNGTVDAPYRQEVISKNLIYPWADAFISGTYEENASVLLLAPQGTPTIAEHIFNILGVKYFDADIYVGTVEDPDIFNNYDMVVAVLDRVPTSSLNHVCLWAQAGNGTAVILHPDSALTNDEHYITYDYSSAGLDFEDWIVDGRFWNTWNPGAPATINVTQALGDLVPGQTFNITQTSATQRDFDSQPNRFVASGATAYLNLTNNFGNDTGWFLMGNATGNVYYLQSPTFTPNWPIDMGWLRIWRALLNEAGIPYELGQTEITEANNIGNALGANYVAVQCVNATGSGTVSTTMNFTGLTATEIFHIFEICPHDNETLLLLPAYVGNYTGATIGTGINITMRAYETQLFRILPHIQTNYVHVWNASVASSSYDAVALNHTLLLRGANGTWGSDGEVTFMCGRMGQPNATTPVSSNGTALAFNYNGSSKTITFNVTYYSLAEVIISWVGPAAPVPPAAQPVQVDLTNFYSGFSLSPVLLITLIGTIILAVLRVGAGGIDMKTAIIVIVLAIGFAVGLAVFVSLDAAIPG
jgi:hypothetical protein